MKIRVSSKQYLKTKGAHELTPGLWSTTTSGGEKFVLIQGHGRALVFGDYIYEFIPDNWKDCRFEKIEDWEIKIS